MTRKYLCGICRGEHPFLPHPTKPGRLVAYCGTRSVCEITGDASSVSLKDFSEMGVPLAKEMVGSGIETVSDLEAMLFSESDSLALLAVKGMDEEKLLHLREYFTKDTLKIILTGTGRCGTVYYAQRLTSGGLPCSHELITLTGLVNLRSKVKSRNVVADSSALSAPYLRYMPEDIKVVHLVRHPRQVIESNMRSHYLNRKRYLSEYNDFVDVWIPEIKRYRRELDRVAAFYLHWNKMIIDTAPQKRVYLQRIEEDDSGLLKFLGVKDTDRLFNDKTANQREGDGPYHLMWNSIRDDLRHELEDFCTEVLGYETVREELIDE